MSLARPLSGRRLTKLDFSLFFFFYSVTRQEIKLYLPFVIYFSVGQLNEVIVYVWSLACYNGNKIKARVELKKLSSSPVSN